MRFAFFAFALLVAAPVASQPLTIPTGETWVFTLQNGQPARARKADPKAVPKRGEVKVSVIALMGTTMTATSNNPDAYIFKAELIGASGKPIPARTCQLPPKNRPVLESWPQKAKAVRVGDFKHSADPGACTK